MISYSSSIEMKSPLFFTFCTLVLAIEKRALQRSHEKSQLQKWEDKFLDRPLKFTQTESLVGLITKVVSEELRGCTVIVLYDIFTQDGDDLLLEKLFRGFPLPYIHGQITEKYVLKTPNLLKSDTCVNYVLFLKDVMRSLRIIGPQTTDKVVLVARSSQWRVYEFLASEDSQNFLNLLVIAKSEKIVAANVELPYILYTHVLYIDALGSSSPQVITSWSKRGFTKYPVQLFPKKISNGFSGHRFIIALAHQPPFVIKQGRDDNNDFNWDGVEVRLMNLLSVLFNFTTDYKETQQWSTLGSAESVALFVRTRKANLGIAGIYPTAERLQDLDVSQSHSQDCAAFVTLTSTALPRYRAILGPFHWTVWLALTLVYLFAIFPLTFSDKHSFKVLISHPQEVENMFWYVFGTFTNAFNFMGRNSWSKTNKFATRLLIGFYWIFTIIITACYTSSIIAFVTLPVFPATVDTPEQLLKGRFQVGTLDKDGWQHWFENSSDSITNKILNKIDLVPDVDSGLRNITKAFFWPYAFLGSQSLLEYIVKTSYTKTNKRTVFHTSSECFVPFGVSFVYGKNSLYSKVINEGVLRALQSGLLNKFKNDVEWETVRDDKGKRLAVHTIKRSLKYLTVEDRALTVDDTQGMFLLLGVGFLLGGISLISEWMGGCFRICKRRRKKSAESLPSNYRSYDNPTPREKWLHRNSHTSGTGEITEASIDQEIDKLFNFEEEVFGESSTSPNKTQED